MSAMLPKAIADALRDAIVRNDFKKVFQGLIDWAKEQDLPTIRDLVFSIQGQYDALKRKEIMGVISYDQANITVNTLRFNLLDMISRLEKGDLGLGDLSFNFGPTGATINITQIHHGSGDNVAGDKTQHNG